MIVKCDDPSCRSECEPWLVFELTGTGEVNGETLWGAAVLDERVGWRRDGGSAMDQHPMIGDHEVVQASDFDDAVEAFGPFRTTWRVHAVPLRLVTSALIEVQHRPPIVSSTIERGPGAAER